jgi:hypothetical protein
MEGSTENIGLKFSQYLERNNQKELDIIDQELIENVYNQPHKSIEKILPPGCSKNRFEHILMIFAQAVKWEEEETKHKTIDKLLIRKEKQKYDISRRTFKASIDRHILKKTDLLQRGELSNDRSSLSKKDRNDCEQLKQLIDLATSVKENYIKSKNDIEQFDYMINFLINFIKTSDKDAENDIVVI